MATIINGTNVGETINGTADHDTINALAGNDVIRGKLGNDTLNGGDDNDTFEGATGDGYDVFNGGEGTDDIAWNGIVGIMGSFSLAANKVEVDHRRRDHQLHVIEQYAGLQGRHAGPQRRDQRRSRPQHHLRLRGRRHHPRRRRQRRSVRPGRRRHLRRPDQRHDRFFGGAGFDRVDWDNGALRLMDGFGPANSIEQIEAGTITGYSGAGTFDFSRTALKGATLVRGDDEVGGIGHNNIVTSLSRAPDVAANLVYDGGGGNDRVTVTIAPGDSLGRRSGSPRPGLSRTSSSPKRRTSTPGSPSTTASGCGSRTSRERAEFQRHPGRQPGDQRCQHRGGEGQRRCDAQVAGNDLQMAATGTTCISAAPATT